MGQAADDKKVGFIGWGMSGPNWPALYSEMVSI